MDGGADGHGQDAGARVGTGGAGLEGGGDGRAVLGDDQDLVTGAGGAVVVVVAGVDGLEVVGARGVDGDVGGVGDGVAGDRARTGASARGGAARVARVGVGDRTRGV